MLHCQYINYAKQKTRKQKSNNNSINNQKFEIKKN